MKTLAIAHIRNLDARKPAQDGRPSYVAAASGLVLHKNHFYVIADDEMSIATFDRNGNSPGDFFQLFEGQLPLDKKERKKRKPDLESLCLMELPDGTALLSFPSGSKPNRSKGSMIFLSSEGCPRDSVEFDLSSLYQSLPFQELNIEGALFQGEDLLLFQRGNSKHRENAILTLDGSLFQNELLKEKTISPQALKSVHRIDLGQLNGFDLSFTDAAPAPDDQILFLSSTEDTENPYDDGPFQGAVLGVMSSRFEIQWQASLEIPAKPEGLSWCQTDGMNSIWIVTDSDDSQVPAALYEVRLKSL